MLPLPLRERAGVRGSKSRSRPSVPYTRGVMPVLPGQTRREILRFAQNDNGEGQNDYGEGNDYRLDSRLSLSPTFVIGELRE